MLNSIVVLDHKTLLMHELLFKRIDKYFLCLPMKRKIDFQQEGIG